jgi:hypothetical protein
MEIAAIVIRSRAGHGVSVRTGEVSKSPVVPARATGGAAAGMPVELVRASGGRYA